MDPISAGLGIVGFGMQLFGGMSASNHAKEAAAISRGIADDELNINRQKQTQMQLEARRMNMEQFRNAQRLRAQATAAAVNQGAQFGSGLQGGLAQITEQTGNNVLGVNQNLQIGQNIFGYNNDISQKKAQMADVQAQMAQDQAWASLGGSLVKNAGTIGGLGQDAFSFGKSAFSLFGNSNSLSGG